jgi:hypothetical protein
LKGVRELVLGAFLTRGVSFQGLYSFCSTFAGISIDHLVLRLGCLLMAVSDTLAIQPLYFEINFG